MDTHEAIKRAKRINENAQKAVDKLLDKLATLGIQVQSLLHHLESTKRENEEFLRRLDHGP